MERRPWERWGAACRVVGIEDLHFHDLRREFGSRLLEIELNAGAEERI